MIYYYKCKKIPPQNLKGNDSEYMALVLRTDKPEDKSVRILLIMWGQSDAGHDSLL